MNRYLRLRALSEPGRDLTRARLGVSSGRGGCFPLGPRNPGIPSPMRPRVLASLAVVVAAIVLWSLVSFAPTPVATGEATPAALAPHADAGGRQRRPAPPVQLSEVR